MSFAEHLRFGQAAESQIGRYLRKNGYTILPVYEKILDTGKGPQLFTASTELVAPDMLTYKGGEVLWIEAKHKTAFSWHRITQRWVTGIDLRHYKDYCKVADGSPWPVVLMFLHRGGEAVGQPIHESGSPSGLFWSPISLLRVNENHRHDGWGKSGMVYWARQEDGGPLMKMADLHDVIGREAA